MTGLILAFIAQVFLVFYVGYWVGHHVHIAHKKKIEKKDPIIYFTKDELYLYEIKQFINNYDQIKDILDTFIKSTTIDFYKKRDILKCLLQNGYDFNKSIDAIDDIVNITICSPLIYSDVIEIIPLFIKLNDILKNK